MSEIPKRWTQTHVWLPPINGEYPRQKSMDDEELYISAAALRELVERWTQEVKDATDEHRKNALRWCVHDVKKLLEGE